MLYYDRRQVGQSVVGSGTHLGTMNRLLLVSDSCGFLYVGCPLWREDSYCRLQLLLTLISADNFWSESPAEQVTFFAFLKFNISPTWISRFRIYIFQEQGGQVIPPRHWVHFLSPIMVRRATLEYFPFVHTGLTLKHRFYYWIKRTTTG